MRVLALALALALVLAGCGAGTGGADADLGCEGTPPAIDDCPRGFLFAECGGAGEPRLACARREDGGWGDCAWFTGGCVARGYEPSTCGADYVCCHDGWPYPAGDYPDARSPLQDLIYAFGVAPWDRTRAMSLDLAIDPALTADVAASWTICEGALQRLAQGGVPCEFPGEASATLGATLSITSQYRGFFGWNPQIEVDLATARARVCAYFYTDVPQGTCSSIPGPLCADAGTVTLSRVPTTDAELPGLAVALDVTFPDGYRFAGSFALLRAP